MAERSPRFALIVVNYASSGLLAENLGTMRLPAGCVVIVVDCFTHEAERARLTALGAAHGWQVLLLDENLGFGGGVNAGAQAALAAGCDVIATLNPDATIEPTALLALVDRARGTRAIVCPHIIAGDGRSWYAGMDLYLDRGFSASRSRRAEFSGRPRREWATGACFAVSAELWVDLDGFDDAYFMYWEDIDLSHRALDKGAQIVLADVIAVHDEGGTQQEKRSDRAKSSTYYYFNIRNRLLYAASHLDDTGLASWMRSARREGYRVLLQGGRRQLLTSLAPWRAYRRGLRDGRALVRQRRPTAL